LVFCNTAHNSDFFSSIDEIPQQVWESLACTSNIYFHPNYLSALAKNHPEIQFSYIVLYNDVKEAIGFSTIQIVDFKMDSVQDESLFSLEGIKCFARKIGLFSDEKPLKILTCGNIFVSGEHGVFIKKNEDKQKVVQQLAKSVVHFIQSDKMLKKEVKAFLLKDFKDDSLIVSDELLEANYHSFSVEPNMVMQIDADWNDFVDYLAAMRTKFRVKAKKAIELSENLEEVIIDTSNFDSYKNDIAELYYNVSSVANFNLARFNIETFLSLKESLKEDFVLKGYFLEGKMVGFLSGLINQNNLDAHFVGLDYDNNRKHAIYQRILYDYIRLAIDRKLTQINFGRTASEIKSSVGAVPQDLTIYVRHKNNIPNTLLSHFIKRIQPTPFAQKFPFKKKELVVKTS